MKKMKKFASILLALVMAMALTVPAFAVEGDETTPTTGSITVSNPVEGETYTAYKIFDVKYSGKNYSYTIKSDSKWYSTVNAYATETNGLTLTEAAGVPGEYYVTVDTDKFSAADFANTLSKVSRTDMSGTPLEKNSEGKLVATGLDLGYYFVTSSVGALCDLTTTNPNATVTEKNDIPFDKTIDVHTVEVGQTVNFTLTAKVPDATAFEKFTYQMKDTMSEGLTFDGVDSIEVFTVSKSTAEDAVLTGDKTPLDSSYWTAADTANGFTLNFDVKTMQSGSIEVGTWIVVTYTATVNDDAITDIEENNAKLTYSHDPSNSEDTKEREDKEYVYSAKLEINKDNKAGQPLAGAEFVLYKKGGTDGNTNLYYRWNEATDDKAEHITWVEDIKDATHVTTEIVGEGENAKAVAYFNGLKDGTYYLKETKAPEGYNPLPEDLSVTIDGTDVLTDDGTGVPTTGMNVEATLQAALTTVQEVENDTGAQMPETGGIGTTIFYTLGGLMVVAAGVLLVTKRRMQSKG